MGRYEDALPIYQNVLPLAQETLGQEHPITVTIKNNYGITCYSLAGVYQSMGRYEDAFPLYEKALTIAQETYGQDHFITITIKNDYLTLRNNIAIVRKSIAEYEDAFPFYQNSIATYKSIKSICQHTQTILKLINKYVKKIFR
jgi:tetratricopeptide (TPR) repeat protein